MVDYVYAQGRGKVHRPHPEQQPERHSEYLWRVKTDCGYLFERAQRCFLGYSLPEDRCRYCFSDGDGDLG